MADNLTLALKIKADLNQALTQIKSLEKQLQQNQATTAKFSHSIHQGAEDLTYFANHAEQAANKLGKTRAGVESISKQLATFRNHFYFLQVLSPLKIGLAGLAESADAYKNYQSRIRLVSQSNQEAQGTFQALMNVANQTGQAFSASAELYTRVARALGGVANSNELLSFTKTISQALTVSGTGAQEWVNCVNRAQ